MRSISIIGAGKVGGALAIAFDCIGVRVDLLVYRSSESIRHVAGKVSADTNLVSWDDLSSIDSEILIIASGDAEIVQIANRVAEFQNGPKIVLHTSGSLSSDILFPLAEAGSSVGSIHPLVSISDPLIGANRLEGAYFCVEGDPDAVAAATEVAEKLRGRPFSIPTKDKPLYHASAVTACGHLVALIDVAVEMLSKCGMTADRAKTVLLPLINSTIANLEYQKPAAALTGTFARGDIEGFKRHLAAFEGRISDEAREIYLMLGLRSTEIAINGHPNNRHHIGLEEAISMAKQKGG